MELQAKLGILGEGSLSIGPHCILFIFSLTPFFLDARDLTTSMTNLSYNWITTVEKERHLWEEQAAIIRFMHCLIIIKSKTNRPW